MIVQDADLEYFPGKGYTYQEYMPLYFYEDCDIFTSDDMIINNKTSFCTADIKIQSEHEDDDGHTSYVTEYDGSLAKIDIIDIKCTIILGGLSKGSFKRSDILTEIMFENDKLSDGHLSPCGRTVKIKHIDNGIPEKFKVLLAKTR